MRLHVISITLKSSVKNVARVSIAQQVKAFFGYLPPEQYTSAVQMFEKNLKYQAGGGRSRV